VAWEPIGGWGAQFTGVLDGNGHTIRNLNINMPTRDYVGLFGYSKGLIKDLALDNVNVNGQFIVGSLAGFNSGYIRNVTVTNAHISAFSIAGGLVGANSLGNIYNAHVRNSPAITGGSACVGGIAAQNVDGVISHSSVTNIGEIRTTSAWGQVGGIVGTNTSRSTIEYSFTSGVAALGVDNFIVGGIAGIQNFATIRMSYSTNDVGGIVNADAMNAYWGLGLGMQHTGGLVGHMRFGTIEQSFATGNVSAVIGDSGGLVGMIVDSSTIRNSFSTGNVANTPNSAGFAGNIGTPMSGFEIRIENSYSLSDNPNGFAAGGTITNSFFELDRINNPSTEAINSPQARTAAQMKQQANFTGWDFNNVWIMESGVYPRLRGVGNQ